MKRLVLSVAVAALACGGGDGKQSDAPAGSTSESPAAAAASGGATITGTVRFTGTPPANPPVDMAEEPACKEQYTSVPTDPVVLVKTGMLQNVFISVTNGLPTRRDFPTPTESVRVDQQGCLYTPRVVGVMQGQTVEITNSDAVLHNIKAVPKVNRGFNISQPTKGMVTQRKFDKAEEAIPVECNVHGWMHGKVFVMDHPFFSVSNDTGAFTIQGLPGGTYTLTAWHEKLGTRTATVTVPEDGSAQTSITFSS